MDWLFDQEETAAALTTMQIIERNMPILTVVHYSDDHSWAFTCGTTDDTDDGRIVCMSHILEIDPTIVSIAHLPPGFIANRDALGEAWVIHQDDET